MRTTAGPLRPSGTFLLAGLLATAALGGAPVLPGGRVDPESLARAVPSDAHFFLHWESRGEKGFARVYLERVRRALSGSEFLDTFQRELEALLEPKRRESFGVEAARWRRVLAGVDGWRLVSSEALLAGRRAKDGRLELVLFARAGAERREELLHSVRELLYAVAGVWNELQLEVGTRDGAATTVLYDPRDFLDQICASGRGDVVAIGSSISLMRQCFHLLEARGADPGLIHTPAYLDSAEKWSRMVRKYGLIGDAPPDGGLTGRLELWARPSAFLDELPLTGSVASCHVVGRSTAGELRWDGVWDIEEAASDAIAHDLRNRPPAGDLLARIPRDALSYAVSSGVDPEGVREGLLEFLITVTGDENLPGRIESALAGLGLGSGPEGAGGFTGRCALLTLGARGEGAGLEHALLLEVEDGKSAADWLHTASARLKEGLEPWGLIIREEEGGAPEARSISLRIPLIEQALWIAVVGRDLVAATSREALDAVARAAEDPTARLDPRDLAWLPAEGALEGVWNGPWDGALFAIDRGLQLVGIAGTLLPDDGPASFAKPLAISLAALRPAAAAFRFLGETRGFTRRVDGRRFASTVVRLEPTAEF